MRSVSTSGPQAAIVLPDCFVDFTRMVQLPLPTLDSLIYPRAADGLIHQCAWCRRVLDRAGRFRIWARELLQGDVSHGMCSKCAPLLQPVRSSL